MKTLKFLIIILIFSLFLNSCKKQNLEEPKYLKVEAAMDTFYLMKDTTATVTKKVDKVNLKNTKK